MENKQSLLEEVIPLAVLKAVTPEAKSAVTNSCLGNELIGIWKFPFRIGRESRVQNINGKLVVSERVKISQGQPNNDIYLVDHGQFLQISRQHFQIEESGNGYTVFDRGSACGTIIAGHKIGGEDRGGYCELNDGDNIRIGSEDSPYIFEFITLRNDTESIR
jgi:pSer/pThr/pTyr-binding forkhead associated (FHA) protein